LSEIIQKQPQARSYWAIVWTQFKRDRLAVCALAGVFGLLLIALCAPLLANSRPYLMRVDGQIVSPLMREIFAPSDTSELMLERVLNFGLVFLTTGLVVLGPLFLFLRRFFRKRIEIKPLMAWALAILSLCPGAFMVTQVCVALCSASEPPSVFGHFAAVIWEHAETLRDMAPRLLLSVWLLLPLALALSLLPGFLLMSVFDKPKSRAQSLVRWILALAALVPALSVTVLGAQDIQTRMSELPSWLVAILAGMFFFCILIFPLRRGLRGWHPVKAAALLLVLVGVGILVPPRLAVMLLMADGIGLLAFCGFLMWRTYGLARGTLVAGGSVFLAGVCLAPFFHIAPRMDVKSYREIAAQAERNKGEYVVLPPVPYSPFEQFKSYQKPDHVHLMGTDKVGRDVLARVIHGARVSLSVGFLAVGVAVIIGIFIGSVSAYHGGWLDLTLQRVVEVVICFPTFLLILTIMAFLEKRSIFNVMLVIGLTGWTGVARLVRGQMLAQKELDYVTAARALGLSSWRIMFRHLLPNSIAPVLVSITFGIAGAILTESGLSFLGFGVSPPTASWGELLNQALAWPVGYWWLTTWPGFMVFLSVTLYNLVGEGLRDALDPRLKV